MSKLVNIALIACFLASASHAQQKRIAIADIIDDGNPPLEPSELSYLKDRMRSIATEALPHKDYMVMSDFAYDADYDVQCRLGRFGGDFTIKVELHESASGVLAGFFSDNAKDMHGLLSVMNEKASAMFKNLPPSSGATAAGKSVPAPKAAYAGSNPCHKEIIELINAKKDLNIPVFMKDLGVSVVKVHASCKTKFACPSDDKVMDVGLTAGCIKQLPKSPAELSALLKSVGLDLLDQSPEIIDSQIEAVEKGGGGSFWVALALDLIGVGLITYGVIKNMEAKDLHSEYRSLPPNSYDFGSKWQKVEDAKTARNILYISGGLTLATGIGVHIWF